MRRLIYLLGMLVGVRYGGECYGQDEGRLLVVREDGEEDFDVALMDIDGSNLTKLTHFSWPITQPSLSPNQNKLAFIKTGFGPPFHGDDLYVMNVDGTNLLNLTQNDDLHLNEHPSWSPDGNRVVFSRAAENETDGFDINVVAANGTDWENLTSQYNGHERDPDWSPDGTKIVFYRSSPEVGGNVDIYTIDENGGSFTRLTDHPEFDYFPQWSPDGTKILYRSIRDGNSEIYVMNYDGSIQTNLTNHPGADVEAAWAPDGSRIVFGSDRDGAYGLYVMDFDGSNVKKMMDNLHGPIIFGCCYQWIFSEIPTLVFPLSWGQLKFRFK